jgi:CheY-like chemotaxis protein
MPRTKEEILIVDDSHAIRTTMSLVLSEMGYRARTAEDGLAALREVRQSRPDILLTDLNMPGMSGFELLSISHRRFPEIQTIAMSGAFLRNQVPSGLTADAFFQKGQGVGELLQILARLAQTERRDPRDSSPVTPLIIHRDANDSSPGACAKISCPECLKTFAEPAGGASGRMFETHCRHCDYSIQYAIVQQSNQTNLQTSQFKLGATFRSQYAPSFSY